MPALIGHTKIEPEWPPHSWRLFSALVAAWAEGGRARVTSHASVDRGAARTRGSRGDCTRRSLVQAFVPVNDSAKLPESARAAHFHQRPFLIQFAGALGKSGRGGNSHGCSSGRHRSAAGRCRRSTAASCRSWPAEGPDGTVRTVSAQSEQDSSAFAWRDGPVWRHHGYEAVRGHDYE